jgi:hypothetical protein
MYYISDLFWDISRCGRHEWDKESKILVDKLDKVPSKKKKKAMVSFNWDRKINQGEGL